MNFEELHAFVIEAKAHCYVGGGRTRQACRPASHDLAFARGAWEYLDSYFGGTDFAGQEIVWFAGEPVWAMNYFGRVVDPDRIDGNRAGIVIKAALTRLYSDEKRFLGGMEFDHSFGRYVDQNKGDVTSFSGREVILVNGSEAYDLDYRGGLIKS